jgi:hypothetical protein
MSRLADQQQALLDVLFAWPSESAIDNIASYAINTYDKGLKAYQTNGHAVAERSLQAAYPVLTQLLGPESLSALARAFWHARPPVRGDLAQWGAALAEFIRASDQLADEPYLADVVALEWALHTSASAANATADAASFALLMQHDPGNLQLQLATGCAVLPSVWPVVSIVGAHLDLSPSFDAVGQRLRAGVAETAVVWRADLRPRVREAQPGEAALLPALLGGLSLGAALDGAPELDFATWLPLAVQSRLLVGVKLRPDAAITRP